MPRERDAKVGSAIAAVLAVATLLVALLAGCGSAPATPPIPTSGILVLSDAQGAIYTVHEDGLDKTVLPALGTSPAWTPDGRIIFMSHRAALPAIAIMNADGSNEQPVAPAVPFDGNLAIKPGMGRNGVAIVMNGQGSPSATMDNPGPQNGTWVLDASGWRLLFPNCTSPSLAPSGTWLTCTLDYDAPPQHRQIWRINMDGSGKQQLTFAGDTPGYPDANASAISPDETTVAIFSGQESTHGTNGFTEPPSSWGLRNVAVIPAAGGPRRLITHCPLITAPGGCVGDNPRWSQDGQRIIYDRGSMNPADGPIWEIGLDGSNNHRIPVD